MIVLFITQKLHQQDAFTVLWIQALQKKGYTVQVLCLEKGNDHYPFPVYSMGKERGAGKLGCLLNFEKAIIRLRYDRVFVHMSPVWYTLGFWWWTIKRVPTYLWYTHYKMQLGVRLFGWFGTRFFCATEQSLPQFRGSSKKIVTGHGIDMHFWPKRVNQCKNPHRLLVVHRLSRSKRLEFSIEALLHLPQSYTLDIYGIPAEKEYVEEMQALVDRLNLRSRVTFHGTMPMKDLPMLYVRHRFILNMASETIDKTMLEAMTCGCYPVTTKGNAQAIGIPAAPDKDSSTAIARFVQQHTNSLPISDEDMYRTVKERHTLEGLIEKMHSYISLGS